MKASYEKLSFLSNGGSLYIWTTNDSHANIKHENITFKQAKQIVAIYGLTNLKKQSL